MPDYPGTDILGIAVGKIFAWDCLCVGEFDWSNPDERLLASKLPWLLRQPVLPRSSVRHNVHLRNRVHIQLLAVRSPAPVNKHDPCLLGRPPASPPSLVRADEPRGSNP